MPSVDKRLYQQVVLFYFGKLLTLLSVMSRLVLHYKTPLRRLTSALQVDLGIMKGIIQIEKYFIKAPIAAHLC